MCGGSGSATFIMDDSALVNAMPEYEHIDYEVSEHIGEIIMKREPVNALNNELLDELLAVYQEASADNDVRVIILTSGLDRAFSAGVDLKEGADLSTWERYQRGKKTYNKQFDLQHTMGKPTIAAVTGAAFEAGITIAVSCNCIVVNEDAEWGYTATNVGIYPGMHIEHLPKIMGRHKAFEVLYSGEPITGEEAEELGIVNYAVPPEEVKPKARELAKKFARVPPNIMEVGHDAFMRTNDLDVRRSRQWQIPTISMLRNIRGSSETRDEYIDGGPPDW